MAKLIGRLKHQFWEASLTSDGKWQSDNKTMEKLLNNTYNPNKYGPWAGAFGFAALEEAAVAEEAEIVERSEPPQEATEEGMVY